MVNSHPDTITASEIIDRLGVKRIANAVGVGETSVYNRKSDFPARWYAPMRDLCEEVGIPCPMELFNWARPSDEPIEGQRAVG